MSDNKFVKILCEDEKVVNIPSHIIPKILILSIMLEDLNDLSDEQIPLQVESDILKKILDYLQYHLDNPNVYQDINSRDPTFLVDWDQEFISQFLNIDNHHQQLLKLYKISHYLNIPTLRKLVAIKFADMIYNAKTPENIRKTFGLTSLSS